MSDKRKVVIDCDPGIDDCFALMMCIKHLDVQGIVAVGGNTGLKYTERNARYMTELTGRPDIPVYAGYDMPMINKPVRATEVHGSGGLGTVSIEEPKKQLEKQHGVDYLVDTFMNHDDITLITLGPLTNVAQALLKEPELKKRIPEILCMGGSALAGNATSAAEFNIYVDPEAAKIVFESGIPIRMVGLNVTRQNGMTPEDVELLKNIHNPVADFAAQIMAFTAGHYGRTSLCDRLRRVLAGRSRHHHQECEGACGCGDQGRVHQGNDGCATGESTWERIPRRTSSTRNSFPSGILCPTWRWPWSLTRSGSARCCLTPSHPTGTDSDRRTAEDRTWRVGRMFTQIYSIQTVEEGHGLCEAGADRVGVLVGVPGGKFPCAIHEEEAAEIFEALKGKAVRVLISVADNERDILDQTKRLHPDVLHLCANFTGSPKFREKMREEIPDVLLMEAVGIVDESAVEDAKRKAEYADLLILDSVSKTVPGVGGCGRDPRLGH